MNMRNWALAHVPDDVLLRELPVQASRERGATAVLLAHLAEVDARGLFRAAAYSSMFAYCVGELRMSEDAAYKRIRAARTARRFPVLFDMVADGRLHLAAIGLLSPHLTDGNVEELLSAAIGRTRSELEILLVRGLPAASGGCGPEGDSWPAATGPGLLLDPSPGMHPDRTTGSESLAPGPVALPEQVTSASPEVPPSRRSRLVPLARGGFELRLDIPASTHAKLRRAQDLLSHAVPSGDVAEVLDRALDALIVKLERRRYASTDRPPEAPSRPTRSARHVPAAVKRAVRQRDGDRCTFTSAGGRRCEARRFLEFDHIHPVARGGVATLENLRLRCRAHNRYQAERMFGVDRVPGRRGTTGAAAPGPPASARRGATHPPRPEPEASADVIPWLRALGFRSDEARRGAEACARLADAPLEARVRHAVSQLAPAPRAMLTG